MFAALNHALLSEYQDFSFRDTSGWPRVGPGEQMPPSLFISLGDDVAGPAIQLIVTPPVPEKMWLDTHYHGSDQFRAQIKGGMLLQRRAMMAPQFGYQKAGIPYREGTLGGLTEDTWMFAVHGDRRGARGTKTRDDGTFLLAEVGEDQLDRFVDSPEDPYWDCLPGRSKGICALALTGMRVSGGFAWGSYDDAGAWPALTERARATTALFGQAEVGPVLTTLALEPGATLADLDALATEIVVVVVDGDCVIADRAYQPGELRVQKADAAIGAIKAGVSGANLIVMVADRRALAPTGLTAPLWCSLARVVTALQHDLAAA